ncbi:hypothetical protein JXA88_02840 [Candidatus Fermentibacteria bacterium]|nr:hypothetical protein [Candidatus Fermentibacteria bacterium]
MSIYLGLFLTSFSALALEITLSRLLSVITWYHLAFFAISTALLGMTAGATKVYLNPQLFSARTLRTQVAHACLRYALAIPVSLIVLCMLPLDLQKSVMSPLVFLFATMVCALPFYYAGIVLSAVITRYDLPIGRLYASDLIGAAMGCLFVLGGLEVLDAPSLILACGAFGVLASMSFAGDLASKGFRRGSIALLAVFLVVPFMNGVSPRGIRPLVVKGKPVNIETYLIEQWNSFSRVVVYKGQRGTPRLWGPSPHLPPEVVDQFLINIDGEAGTVMWRFGTLDDLTLLKYDVTNVGYYLDRPGRVCVIGVGAGRDVQSAILFGHDEVVGVEVNPIFIDLLRGGFRDFAGLADREGVDLIVDDARSYLTRSENRFSVIQMSLIDTWAATGAGAFSLSENALYTVEAWKVFLERLADTGYLTVSRWHDPENAGETGRVISLGVASLLAVGVPHPAQHLALITTNRISTLLVSRSPFEEDDILGLRAACDELGYDASYLPGQPVENSSLAGLISATSWEELNSAASRSELNYAPPTDESPYFFNMLRLRHLGDALDFHAGVLRGNVTATLTLFILLISLGLIAVITIVAPLVLRPRLRFGRETPLRVILPGAAYFALIGAGFMHVEIGLIQKLTVFLGHPVYALGILLFTLIASTGVGSFLSDRFPLARRLSLAGLALITVFAVLALRHAIPLVFSGLIANPLKDRIAASILLIFPLGLLMGCFFPTGMRLARARDADDTPWFWALNGIFGVLCSVGAVFISVYVGISTNFYIAACCYAASGVFLTIMRTSGGRVTPGRPFQPSS